MKRNAPKLLVILVLLLIIVGGAYVFLGSNQGGDGEQKPTVVKKGEIVFLNSKQDGTLITQKFKAYVNGKDIDIELQYNYRIENLSPDDQSGYTRLEIVEGSLNGVVLFSHQEKSNSTSQKASWFDTSKIDKEYDINYFDVIRGTDGKDYIAIATHIYDVMEQPSANYLYILNDELKIINNVFDDISHCNPGKSPMIIHPGLVGLLVQENIWYPNKYKYNNLRKNYISLKIENDKVYYLYHNVAIDDAGNFGTVEERVYTINEDKLEYTVLNTYRAESNYGDACKNA